MSPVFAIIDAPIIAVIVGAAVLLFGAPQLPKLARAMGLAKKEFEAAVKGSATESASSEPPATPPAEPPTAPPAAPAPPQQPH